jgi:hypothetical protein
MARLWYLSRGGQVFGPVTDTQLAESVAAGRVLPTDHLNVAGQPNWVLASTVPGLVPAPKPQPAPLSLDPEPLSLDPEPVATRVVRTTCFACFSEVSLNVAPGAVTAPCPRCGAAVETGESASQAAPSANQAAFAALESPAAFKERMQKKVAEAQAAAARDAAILGSVLGAIGPG